MHSEKSIGEIFMEACQQGFLSYGMYFYRAFQDVPLLNMRYGLSKQN